MFSKCFFFGANILLRPHGSQLHCVESQVSINYITLLLSTYPSYPPIPLTPLHYSTCSTCFGCFFYASEGENWMTKMAENWEVGDSVFWCVWWFLVVWIDSCTGRTNKVDNPINQLSKKSGCLVSEIIVMGYVYEFNVRSKTLHSYTSST